MSIVLGNKNASKPAFSQLRFAIKVTLTADFHFSPIVVFGHQDDRSLEARSSQHLASQRRVERVCWKCCWRARVLVWSVRLLFQEQLPHGGPRFHPHRPQAVPLRTLRQEFRQGLESEEAREEVPPNYWSQDGKS